MARKRLYIPITRSGSSILASILVQLINAPKAPRDPNQPPDGNPVVGCGCLLVFIFFLLVLVKGCS